jgi:hypothetical protein
MRSSKQALFTLVHLIVFVWLAASAALAQTASWPALLEGTSRAELLAGLTFEAPADVNQAPLCRELALPCASPRTAPDFGGTLSIAVHVVDKVAVVGEFAISRNAWEGFVTGCPPAGATAPAQCPGGQITDVLTALAGLRVRTAPLSHGREPNVRLFGQVLVGTQASTIGPSRRAVQPGVGADFYLRNGITLRIEADYCFAPGGLRDLSTSRFLIGVVLPPG